MRQQSFLRSFSDLVARIRNEISGPTTVPVNAPPLIPGYVIGEQIGEGGMGAVYLAQDEVLGRDVAIKVIADLGARNDAACRLFLREAKAMASVAHPNVVHIYGYGESDRGPYIVMERIEGESLAQRLRSGSPLPAQEALGIVRQTIDGLEAAWEKGIVHRDVKPSNILLDRKGQARVCDFGLARPVPTEVATDLTDPETIAGTPHYMSPEQASGWPTDLRSDIYSLGVVLYEMLTGFPPISSRKAVEVLVEQIEGLQKKLEVGGLKVEIVELYEWMTRKDPDERPATYAELRTRLEAIETGVARRSPAGIRWLLSPAGIAATVFVLLAAILLVWSLVTGWPDLGQVRTSGTASAPPTFLPTLMVTGVENDTGDPELDDLEPGLRRALHRGLVGGLSDFVVIPPEEFWGPRFPMAEIAAQLVIGGSIARADTGAEGGVTIALNLHRVGNASSLGEREVTGSLAALPELQASLVSAAIEMLAAEFGNVEYSPMPLPTQDPVAEAHFERGLSWMSQGNSVELLERAIAEFQAAIRIDPNFADAHAHLGKAKLAMYPLTRDPTVVYLADGDCSRAIEFDDRLADGWLCRGWVNVRLNTNDLALEAFVKAIERGATVEGHRGLGHAYRRLGYPDLAEDYLRGAVELAPGYAGAYMSLGYFYGERGEYDKAEAAYLEATRWPDPLAWLSLGAMRYLRGNYAEAIDALESSLEARRTADAYSNLGLAHMMQGRLQEAIAAFEQAVSLADPSFMHYGNLGRAYWLAGESGAARAPFAAARQHAQAQIDMDETSTARAVVPYYALRLDGEQEARRVLAESLHFRPDYNETHFWAAIVWSELGEREGALDAIEEALERGYSRTEIRDAPEFAGLRNDARFQRFINGDQN